MGFIVWPIVKEDEMSVELWIEVLLLVLRVFAAGCCE
jgi:hypothetical protein